MEQEFTFRVLIYTDGSEFATRAIRFLRASLRPANQETHLLAIAKSEEELAQADEALDEGQHLLAEASIQAEPHTRQGSVPEQLLQAAEEGNYDLLVLGTPQPPPYTLPGVPEPVNTLAGVVACSYLVVRGERKAPLRILACTGGYRYGEEVIRTAAKIAQSSNAHVTILHVGEAPPVMYTGLHEMEEPLTELLKTHTREAYYLKRGARILVERGVEGEIKFVRGIVAQEIFRIAREGDYDLIAVGESRAHSPFRRVLLGNVTRTVLEHARRPVLVVRPRPERLPRHLLNRLRFARRHRH
jgi:nucleotide-binding universal stress UspA family protein